MSWLTNEILFYGGISVTVLSLLSAILYLIISHVQRIRLNAQFDVEYGKEFKVFMGEKDVTNDCFNI